MRPIVAAAVRMLMSARMFMFVPMFLFIVSIFFMRLAIFAFLHDSLFPVSSQMYIIPLSGFLPPLEYKLP